MLQEILKSATARPFNPFEAELPERLAVLGTGPRGRRCRQRLESLGIAVPCFLDNNPARQGLEIDGLRVLSPARFRQESPGTAVIIASYAHLAIFPQLVSLGVTDVYRDELTEAPPLSLLRRHAPELERVRDSLADGLSRETFENIIRLRFYGTPMPALSPYPLYAHPKALARPGDVVIDGGAARGDTAELFLEQSGNMASIHCFEPTPSIFEALAAHVPAAGLQGVQTVCAALWDSDGTTSFFESFGMPAGNRVGGDGGTEVATLTLDNYVESRGIERVDLIKLDVEGAELAALRGAERTIRRFRPKLQVCLYHEWRDLWELPLYIRELEPSYSLHLGHHTATHLDTVLYCAPPGRP